MRNYALSKRLATQCRRETRISVRQRHPLLIAPQNYKLFLILQNIFDKKSPYPHGRGDKTSNYV